VLREASAALSHASGEAVWGGEGGEGGRRRVQIHEAIEVERVETEARLLELLEEERDMAGRLWDELERVRGELVDERREREKADSQREHDRALIKSQRVETARLRAFEKANSELERRLQAALAEARCGTSSGTL
jgi:hypothetical protein